MYTLLVVVVIVLVLVLLVVVVVILATVVVIVVVIVVIRRDKRGHIPDPQPVSHTSYAVNNRGLVVAIISERASPPSVIAVTER